MSGSSATAAIGVVAAFALTATATTVSLTAGGCLTRLYRSARRRVQRDSNADVLKPRDLFDVRRAPRTVTVSGGVAGQATAIITAAPSVIASGERVTFTKEPDVAGGPAAARNDRVRKTEPGSG